MLYVADEAPPFAYVRVEGEVQLGDDLVEMLVRLVPTRVVTGAGVAD